MAYDINTVYEHYKLLSKKQRQQLLGFLQEQGVGVTKIEAYEYHDAPGIKHLFFHFEDCKEPVPYFMLDKEVWEQIQLSIMQI